MNSLPNMIELSKAIVSGRFRVNEASPAMRDTIVQELAETVLAMSGRAVPIADNSCDPRHWRDPQAMPLSVGEMAEHAMSHFTNLCDWVFNHMGPAWSNRVRRSEATALQRLMFGGTEAVRMRVMLLTAGLTAIATVAAYGGDDDADGTPAAVPGDDPSPSPMARAFLANLPSDVRLRLDVNETNLLVERLKQMGTLRADDPEVNVWNHVSRALLAGSDT